MDREERAREIQRQIGAVLLRDWDPIGVADEPSCSDEYDGYVGPVYRLLVTGASARAIAEHLAKIEATAMGFSDTDPQTLIPVAEQLLRVDVRLGPDATAT